MCGIVGLHLRDQELHPELGRLLSGMLGEVADRGPDSAGVALYGSLPADHMAVSVLNPMDGTAGDLWHEVQLQLIGVPTITEHLAGGTVVLSTRIGPVGPDELRQAVLDAAPDATIVSSGRDLVVYKGVGYPRDLAEAYDLADASGWQGLAHTRMATESAVTAEACHPFSVGPEQCLVHNGSFSNHATIRRELEREGVVFDSDNDSEVAARFVAARLADGDDLEKALHHLAERFDGFYTLLVTTADGFAVVRDPIACKPAIVAEHPRWVAMASEFRALAGLPGIDEAHIFEPAPGAVHTWRR